jgi:hypothetical protein
MVLKEMQGDYLRVVVAIDAEPVVKTGIAFEPVVVESPLGAC